MIVSSLAFLFWGEYLSLIQIFHYWDSQTPGLRENSSEIKMEPSVMCVCVCVCVSLRFRERDDFRTLH